MNLKKNINFKILMSLLFCVITVKTLICYALLKIMNKYEIYTFLNLKNKTICKS
jgi:hypothetical protein